MIGKKIMNFVLAMLLVSSLLSFGASAALDLSVQENTYNQNLTLFKDLKSPGTTVNGERLIGIN